MSTAKSAEEAFSDNDTWWTYHRKRPSFVEPTLHPPTNLDEVLADQTFIDYGNLGQYEKRYQQGRDVHAYNGVQLIKRIQTPTFQLTPYEQADLLIRYMFYKEPENPIAYLARNYSVPTITWELALVGFEKGTTKAKAWEKLLHADRVYEQRRLRRQHIREHTTTRRQAS